MKIYVFSARIEPMRYVALASYIIIIGVFFNFSSHVIGVVSGLSRLSTGIESSFSDIDDVY